MHHNRRFYLSLLGVVAWSTTAADSVLDILDAASLHANHSSLLALAATASTFDLLALGAIAVFSSQYAWTREGIIKNAPQAQKTLAACCSMFSFGALVLSLVSLIATKLGSNDSNYGSAHIALWVLACLGQIALFTSPMWSPSKLQVHPRMTSGPRDSAVSEMRYSTPSHNLYMMEPAHPSSPLAALPSPTMSIRSSQSLKSWKESLQQAVRPMASRSKLMNRPSYSRDVHSAHSDVLSVNSTADGFDLWEVDAQSKETAVQLVSAQALLPRSQNSISHGTPLEPIPGSRPVSPAHPLNGPFPSDLPEEDAEELQPPPKLALDTSRPPSPAGSEAHIHPLFRSESPGPPPAATPGTNIMASPLADKVITCPVRPYNRMRSNSNLSSSNLSQSRATSPKPIAHARSFIDEHDRTLSFSSQRSQRSQQSKRSQSRSRSPPSRQMTPPIPDSVFVPSSSRSSVNVARSNPNFHTSYSQ